MAAMKLSFPSTSTTTNASHFHLLTSIPLTLCFPLSPKPQILQTLTTHKNHLNSQTRPYFSPSAMAAAGYLEEVLPPVLDSTSDPPPIFDGTTRLYISITCPYAQRAWIARNCKVPALEHNNEVRGESLDLIKYIDSHFDGPSLLPDDLAKKEFTDVMFAYTDSFHKDVTASFKAEGISAAAGSAYDYVEDALTKFNDGPFFLGQFSLVDIAYAPFIERHSAFLSDVKKYDLTAGRPKLATWIQEMNKIDAYKQTQSDLKVLVESYKRRFLA